jgi:hypothetical protein
MLNLICASKAYQLRTSKMPMFKFTPVAGISCTAVNPPVMVPELPLAGAVFICDHCSETHMNFNSPLGFILMSFSAKDAEALGKALINPPAVQPEDKDENGIFERKPH